MPKRVPSPCVENVAAGTGVDGAVRRRYRETRVILAAEFYAILSQTGDYGGGKFRFQG